MAGANNAFLKRLGFRSREVTKMRAKYGAISSAKDARLAAGQAGVRVPPKLAALLEGTASKLAGGGSIGLKNRAADIVAKRIEQGVSGDLKVGDKLGRREGDLAKRLSSKDVDLMARAINELTALRAGRRVANPMSAAERARAGELLEGI